MTTTNIPGVSDAPDASHSGGADEAAQDSSIQTGVAGGAIDGVAGGAVDEARILVVEDDLAIRETLRLLFELSEINAEWADTGKSALAILDQMRRPPSLIIVDGRLPDTHGLELISLMRKQVPAETAIYLFSADSTVAAPARALTRDLGINGFIPKPFDADSLVNLASKHTASCA